MHISRRAFTAVGMGAATLAAAPRLRARTDRLTLLVAQPAGGVTDVFARAMAPVLGERLGRHAVVENVSGASGSIAAARLLAAVPDGSTLLVGSPSETVLAPLMMRAVRYSPVDFRLLGLVNESPLALYARHGLPANDLDELVALARKRSDKGEPPLNYGSTGQGSIFHLVTEMLLAATGSQATHVSYRGGVPLLIDLRGGVLDFTMLPVDALLASMVAGGSMKVLGVTSARRLEQFPAAASFDDSKAAPALGRPTIWVGLLAPAAMSDSVRARLHRSVSDVLGDAGVRAAIHAAGGTVPSPMSLVEAASFYTSGIVKLQALARAAHIEPI